MIHFGILDISRMLVSAALIIMCGVEAGLAQVQITDPDFDPKVSKPTYRKNHPKVLIDEAHHNFHTAYGGYKPFADLISNDGYRVTPNKGKFTKTSLQGYDVLVIANALGAEKMKDAKAADPAFTEKECDAVKNWVIAGGSLLLIADHAPMGAAAANLGKRFEIQMSNAFTIDWKNYMEKSQNPTWLVFSRENELLGDHPIFNGRDKSETIRSVTTFAGQSLKGPKGSMVLLKLADSAVDTYPTERGKSSVSAAGRAQGLVLKPGKGRVVILGEAAMLSAQVLRRKVPLYMGMNYAGSDNRQLALNIMHWLSGLLD